MKLLLMIVKNVRRNLVRTGLMAVGTVMLVFVVTLIWSVLDFLDKTTREKASNLKAIVSERWQIPSMMPYSYALRLEEGAAREPGDVRPTDSMTWQFFIGFVDKTQKTFDNFAFFFALEPRALRTMMDELDELPPEKAAPLEAAIRKMESNVQGVIVGKTRLEKLNKRVGERFTVYSQNYRDIELEFEIVGQFPEGRYDQSAAMNRTYLVNALDAYKRKNGEPHPLEMKTLNLVWLRVPDQTAFQAVAGQIMDSPEFKSPAVKVETASSGVATFLEAYKDLIWGMRYLLAPSILVTLSLVISNAISISVRERRMEIAVMKVLGFRPGHILVLVLGEAMLIGTLGGLLSAGATYYVINQVLGGLKFPIAFFAAFFIPSAALWWGPAMGAATAFAGSIMPALSARKVRVADVFSKVS